MALGLILRLVLGFWYLLHIFFTDAALRGLNALDDAVPDEMSPLYQIFIQRLWVIFFLRKIIPWTGANIVFESRCRHAGLVFQNLAFSG